MSILTHSRGLSARKRIVASVAALMAAGALALAAPLSASAISSVTVSPSSGPASGYTTTVTVNGTEAGHTYRVGLCSDANVGTPAIAPACQYIGAEFTGTGGTVTQSGDVQRILDNAHYGVIPGQPATFNCGTTLCRIVVTDNHSSGSFPSVSADIAFS